MRTWIRIWVRIGARVRVSIEVRVRVGLDLEALHRAVVGPEVRQKLQGIIEHLFV